MENYFEKKRYFIVFLITLGLFLSAFYLSNYFSNKKLNQLKTIKDRIAIDILSSETQFSLLSNLPCKDVSRYILSSELEELGHKLQWSEENLQSQEEIIRLKNFYSLLEIKDYLLMKKISEQCKINQPFILYFYVKEEHCPDCKKQEFVLSALKDKYPELRIYSFDYAIDLSAVKSLLQIYNIKDTKLPALVFNDEVLIGLQKMDDMEDKIEESLKSDKEKLKNQDKLKDESKLKNKENRKRGNN